VTRQQRTFGGILRRFLEQFAWCLGWGFLLGLVHRFGTPPLRQTVEHILKEHPAPVSFNAIATAAVTVLGLFVALFGRTRSPVSAVRDFLCYRPAELALSLAAVFFGLAFGFTAVHTGDADARVLFGGSPEAILGFAALAFAMTVVTLLAALWASFDKASWPDERSARLVAAACSVAGASAFWYAYCTSWRLWWLPISN
jgi:hypothetical protein